MTALNELVVIYEKGGIEAVKRAPNVSANDLSELLVLKASSGEINWAIDLVGAGADPNYVDDEGNCALSQCIQSSGTSMGGVPAAESLKLAIELLSVGASPNLRYGDTWLLELAVIYDRADIATALILAGADLHALSDLDCTVEQRMRRSDHFWGRQLLKIAMTSRRV